MKLNNLHIRKIASLLIMLLLLPGLHAQDNGGSYYTYSGSVKNKSNKKKLEHVNISVVGTSISTVSNEDGQFTIKVGEGSNAFELEFSCLGFFNNRISISRESRNDLNVLMTPRSILLGEVKVTSWKNPRDLVLAAIYKIPQNYSNSPNLLTGFYRETAQKGRNYITVSEAVTQVYKTPYNENTLRDRVQILKGRKLISPKQSDTLAVKLLGGPNLSVFMDVVKNPDILLSEENVSYFEFKMEDFASIDDRLQYVVSFYPRVNLDYALHYGKFYIDQQTLAFTKADFRLDMSDRNKATRMILQKKPAGLRFNPGEVSFIINYKQDGDKTRLNYIRNEIKFKCDWKRRLFATSYTIVSEMVVTDCKDEEIEKIPKKMAFSQKESLSDQVMSFFDEDFWGAYNIIEPDESLESAVSKLLKRHK